MLAEFYWVSTRHLQVPLAPGEAARQVERFARAWLVLDVTALIVLEALRGCRRYGMAYWDAQIWTSARLNQLTLVFGENFSALAVLEGVRFVNPFSDDFRLDAWASGDTNGG